MDGKKNMTPRVKIGIVMILCGSVLAIGCSLLASLDRSLFMLELVGIFVIFIGIVEILMGKHPVLALLWVSWIVYSVLLHVSFMSIVSANLLDLGTFTGILYLLNIIWFIAVVVATVVVIARNLRGKYVVSDRAVGNK